MALDTLHSKLGTLERKFLVIINFESDWLQNVLIMGIVCTYITFYWNTKLFYTILILYLDSK
jgi:hypothetical protein